ncbi:DUF3392 domain-containing protein [Aliagarivorans marinus]|uniref:DUF3392 domain-containing protein n=1 Tax=Aliagarivorans marinus TaxID=561965 RepID=UPI00047C01E2|nr:DUF3392 domain-containing protein [Aliagarivorans marinus]
MSFINELGRGLIPYLSEISMAVVACTLVMVGGDINRAMRAVLVRQHFLVRTIAFIALNAFGYGLLIVYATPWLRRMLLSLQPAVMLAVVIGIFLAIGMWAQRNRHV